jgi:hypothetical protein
MRERLVIAACVFGLLLGAVLLLKGWHMAYLYSTELHDSECKVHYLTHRTIKPGCENVRVRLPRHANETE